MSRYLVVGASNHPEKYGSKVFLDLRDAGYEVVPINLRDANVHGTNAYPSLTSAHAGPDDLVVLVVPPAQSLIVVEEAARLGVRRIWFQPGSESEDALALCERLGIAQVHGSCVMIERHQGHPWLSPRT